ncbi:MAG: pseudouridylate synthase [Bacteroidales bacterium]|nr:pseudouridylate synthase [Bacteroidales bacterium]MBQ2243578.1 pseudouridylate synthase [Bacteroidales bacterium]
MENIAITEEYLRSIDVHTVLPQQEPFVMIDKLVHFELTTSTTETQIRESNIFVDEGRFSPSGMMENIAQTCAARVGFYNKYILHKEVQVGFIGAVRNYTVHELPAVGTTIYTKVDILEEVFGMTLATAEIRCGDKIIATAEIKLSVRNIE